jgi:Obg family GTPase CgtA-like protein
MLFAVKNVLLEEKKKQAEQASIQESQALPVLTLATENDGWQAVKQEDAYLVTGANIERFALRTDFSNPEGVARLRDIMKKTGILHELLRQGIEAGDRIVIADKGEIVF